MSKKRDIQEELNPPQVKDDRNDPNSLPGWPGYRTRDGRSGYDPIDTRTEAAHTFATFIKSLFTGKLRIKNSALLFLSGVLGLIFVVPFILAMIEVTNGNLLTWDAWVTFLVAGVVGVAVLVNFVKNLI